MTAFAIIGLAGGALLVLSLLVGDVLDGFLPGADFAGGYLSTAALGGFAGAFGLAGWVSEPALGAGPASLIGAGAGLALAWAAVRLTRALIKDHPADRAMTSTDLVGMTGTVVTGIAEGTFGQVLLTARGHRLKVNARADHAIETGAEVWVTESLSETSVRVERVP